MAEGSMKCVKYLMFAFNLLFFIFGILIIVGGALLTTEFRQLLRSVGQSISSFAGIVIAVGVIMLVISFFGCCGAFRENYCLLVTFAAFLALVLLVEVGSVVAGVVMKNKLIPVIEEHLKGELKAYYISEDITISWDQRQTQFECCGASNYTDWTQNLIMNGSVPESCCIPGDGCNVTGLALTSAEYAENIIFTTGCVESLGTWVLGDIGKIIGIAVGLTFIQVVGIFLASCLAWDVKKKYEFV